MSSNGLGAEFSRSISVTAENHILRRPSFLLHSFLGVQFNRTEANDRRKRAGQKMRLERATNERKLYLCRWYFYGGFLLLPFLWAINAIWFFKEAFRTPAYDEQKMIKTYVIRSSFGAVVWIVGLIGWSIVFQLNRAGWGETGDNLSFVIPTGRA